jgi:cytochrome P450
MITASTCILVLLSLPHNRCIARDQEMYPDPETFRPERFDEVRPNGQLPLDPHKFSFSMGRRSVVLHSQY